MKIGIIANKTYSEKIKPFFAEFLTWLKDNNVDFCVEAEFAELAAYPHGVSALKIRARLLSATNIHVGCMLPPNNWTCFNY